MENNLNDLFGNDITRHIILPYLSLKCHIHGLPRDDGYSSWHEVTLEDQKKLIPVLPGAYHHKLEYLFAQADNIRYLFEQLNSKIPKWFVHKYYPCFNEKYCEPYRFYF